MNWLDILIVLVIVGFVVTAYTAGLIREVVTLVAAIAGIVIAIMAGVPALSDRYDMLDRWARTHNPFYERLSSTQVSPDLLALIPFAALVLILYLAGRGAILSGRKRAGASP